MVETFTEKYSKNIEILTFHTDCKGDLQIKGLCDMFADMADTHSHLCGIGVRNLLPIGQSWMLHSLHIKIKQIPTIGDKICFETWSSETDRLFALRDFHILSEDLKTMVQGTSEWMMIDMEHRRPIRLTPLVIEGCNNTHIPHTPIPGIIDLKTFPDDLPDSREFWATFHNIDFNGHVTQASYSRWIIDSLPFEFLKTHKLKEIELIYEHEVMPDTKVIASYKTEQTESNAIKIYHKLSSPTESKTHCSAISIWE